MAEKNGVSIDIARKFIANYYSRYKGVEEWQIFIREEVLRNRKVNNELRSDKGWPVGESVIDSITGRRYYFREYDNPYYDPDPPAWKKGDNSPTNFSPPQLKNYPVQGFATADIVPMVLGKVFRYLSRNRVDIRMINTVHDSLIFDCREEHVIHYAKKIKEIMEDAPTYIKEEFGIDFDLPLSVEMEAGKSWAELSPLTL